MRRQDSREREETSVTERRERRLKRFAPVIRERVAALTCCSPEALDVADSFPGLLVALVSDFATAEKRAEAFQIIVEGGSPRAAAERVGLPAWLRKLPPETYRTPIGSLPDGAQFSGKISNFLPTRTSAASDWLLQVSSADETCSSDFALWVARHCNAIAASRRRQLFLYMAAWAWHARQPDTPGYQLIDRPWSAKMGLRRATEELMRWRRRTELACLLGEGIRSPWLEEGHVDGFEFVHLSSLEDFMAESQAMKNCLDQYADRLGTGLIRIFSVRQEGRGRVADIEVGPSPTEGAMPSIMQIKGPGNRQASQAVWQAAQKWLENQKLNEIPRRPGAINDDEVDNNSGTQRFWQPYLDWLPAHRREAFEALIRTTQQRPVRQHLPHPVEDAASTRRRALPRRARVSPQVT